MESPEPKPRLRPRISLLSLLLLTAVVACLIVVTLQARELAPLRIENKRLRSEVGELSVEDPNRLHGIRVATTDENHWRFRVLVPDQRRYWFGCMSDLIPKGKSSETWVIDEGEAIRPSGGSGSLIESGEHLIDVYFSDDDATDQIEVKILLDGAITSIHVLDELNHDWIRHDGWQQRFASREFLDFETVSPRLDEALVLVRYRAKHVDRESRGPDFTVGNFVGSYGNPLIEEIEEPCEGLLVWIAPQK
ncbi:hypothetical protein [Botrimarina mediterranea]|uniref:Uncharacterized protein n=1 Tax=Botrimarina mediterranea TaxID=2528022 RepID=A0A518K693_9BACT|nr:hypothetical protein [Botrimarina mediterranea]QDV73315.1 hypothetical protein Spa11_15110 [Botrimarina mediterranea]QDV77832.1 hypothetical protein K2D_14370 [Planctomycetes bacterium K2D]